VHLLVIAQNKNNTLGTSLIPLIGGAYEEVVLQRVNYEMKPTVISINFDSVSTWHTSHCVPSSFRTL